MEDIKKGIYRHFRGKDYIVFGTFRHSETKELYVAYRALHGKQDNWIRPLYMFTSLAEKNGEFIPRFEFIRELKDDKEPIVTLKNIRPVPPEHLNGLIEFQCDFCTQYMSPKDYKSFYWFREGVDYTICERCLDDRGFKVVLSNDNN